MIGGFIITGNQPKKVALRGIGPSLINSGLSDVLADPTLELRGSDGVLLMQNNDWQDDPMQAAELMALGLAPQDPKESGIVATLQPGAYTAILAGKNQTAGIGLVEIYDADAAAASQLANISTRGFVQTGDNVMIGGFILGQGSANAHVAVRGLGPSLSQSGLSDVLADPILELRDGNGALLIANDNWQDDPVSAAQLMAYGLAPHDSLESGIFASLPPGAFTAILAETKSGVGIGLVEVYADVHTLIVSTTADSGPGSLRDTIAAASDGDTIQFDAALNGQSIILTSDELAIDKNITISGPGPSQLAVSRDSGAANFRIFHLFPGHTVIIKSITISGGNTVAEPGAGGVWNDHSTLTIDSCTVRDNVAQFKNGGGILNDGSGGKATLTILNSTVSGNTAYTPSGATSAGGGISNENSNSGSVTLTIVNSSVTGNVATYTASPNISGGYGGGIYISALNGGSGTLTIANSIVSDNVAGPPDNPPFLLPGGYGGGITNYGALTTITNTTINGNQAGLGGGGIDNSGTLTITDSTLNDNRTTGLHDGVALGYGGGISNTGPLTITNSTISNNITGNSGGALYGGGTITNSTISGNQAVQGDGGGIYGSGSITNSTISDNRANGNGGGISATGTLELGNTILKAGASGANIFNNGGTVTSHGYNLSSDDGGGFLTATGDQINIDPILGPLQNNGGPTFTHELLTGSPAINAGDPNFAPPPDFDQRGPGYPRIIGGRIDVGSFEFRP